MDRPDGISIDIFNAIVQSKHKTRKTILQAKSSEISRLFSAYFANSANLFPITPHVFTESEKEALIHCYESSTTVLENIREELLKASPCPYCGIDGSRELDHYLPKEEFPEFSILNVNLIPTCGECNKRKGMRWKDGASRLFFNAYFDDIPDEKMLFADVSLEGKNIMSIFRLERPTSGISDELWEVLKNHITSLGLPERYSKEISRTISEFKSSIANAVEDGRDLSESDISKLSADESRKYCRLYGKNYWQVAIYDEIAKNHELCQLLLI